MTHDNPMVKYILIYAVIAVVGVTVGDAVSDTALAEIVKQLAIIGPVLFILVQRQEDAKKEIVARQEENNKAIAARQDAIKVSIEKGLNGDLDKRIEGAVERVLDRWTNPSA